MSIGRPTSRTACLIAGLMSAGLAACAPGRYLQETGGDFNGTWSMRWCDQTGLQADCSELARFTPHDMTVRANARGDLDGDGDEDALAVIERDADRTASSARGLLLLNRDPGGSLREAMNSPNAILCRKCGGMMGEPLQGIRIGHGDFTLRFEGGSRELWSSEYRFEYSRDRDLWLLTQIVHDGFDRADGKAAKRQLIASDFGEVSLEHFDPEDYPANALP